MATVPHPSVRIQSCIAGAAEQNVAQTIERTTFFDVDGRPGLCFIDQFVDPTAIAQGSL